MLLLRRQRGGDLQITAGRYRPGSGDYLVTCVPRMDGDDDT